MGNSYLQILSGSSTAGKLPRRAKPYCFRPSRATLRGTGYAQARQAFTASGLLPHCCAAPGPPLKTILIPAGQSCHRRALPGTGHEHCNLLPPLCLAFRPCTTGRNCLPLPHLLSLQPEGTACCEDGRQAAGQDLGRRPPHLSFYHGIRLYSNRRTDRHDGHCTWGTCHMQAWTRWFRPHGFLST